jgi:hypothetical protein
MTDLKNPNPLDVLGLRRVEFCPPHFSTTNIPKTYNIEHAIADWINDNLSGRFYIGTNVNLDNTDSIKIVYTVGFEDSKELSFFMLACPFLKYN